MNRTFVALVAGTGIGASAAYFFATWRDSHVSPLRASGPIETAAAILPRTSDAARSAPSADVSTTAARAYLYARAAAAGASEIERLIRDAASEVPSAGRELALDLLFSRYAELDPERAIAVARDLGRGPRSLAPLFAVWAAVDPAAALAALGAIGDAAEARAIGIAMLRPLGGDEHALDEVMRALPASIDSTFRAAAFGEFAASDPSRAFERAFDIADLGLREAALVRVVETWARTDSRAALEKVNAIEDDLLRPTLQAAVTREWARLDPKSFLDYVASLDRAGQERLSIGEGIREAARLDPQRTLDVAVTLPPRLRTSMQQQTLIALAQHDPEAAVRELDGISGPALQGTQMVVARLYAQRNPDAALAWARASGINEILTGVIGGIAQNDPNRALDIALALPQSDRMSALSQLGIAAAGSRKINVQVLADRILALPDDPARNNALQFLLQPWAAREPQRTMDWLLTNQQALPPGVLGVTARSLGQTDVAAAEAYLGQIPQSFRSEWLAGVAQGYAQSDARGAAAWIGKYRGDDAYPQIASAVAGALARIDPPAAARLLGSIAGGSPESDGWIANAADEVAQRLARQDPSAAASWAVELGSQRARDRALQRTIQSWASNDLANARSWTLRLPAGENRDAALSALIAAGSRNQGPDPSLLNAFSADMPRQRAVLNTLYTVAQRDPSEARSLVQRHITDPALRAQAERMLENVRAPSRGQPFMPPIF